MQKFKDSFILNGLGCVEDIHEAYKRKFSAFAGSSMFVFHGIHQAVLLTQIEKYWKSSQNKKQIKIYFS